MDQAWLDILKLLVIPLLFAVVGFLFRQISQVSNEVKATHSALHNDLERVKDDLNRWKLSVTENYATKQELDRMEKRILVSIEKLELKLDALLMKLGN